MRTKFVILLLLWAGAVLGQETVSDRIKTERDNELNEIKNALKENNVEIKKLQDRLSESNSTQVRIASLDGLQQEFDKRLKFLETASKRKANYNGQLAFIELLSVQRDLQPAQLFSSSQIFFKELGNISNLQNYSSFTTWKTEYDAWYQEQDKKDQMLQLVNNSIDLIGNAANKIPLYGSIVQTATSGVGVLFSSFRKKNKVLKEKTPEMLHLLSTISQFENQKAIIDYEWEQINIELSQLQAENDKLLKEQIVYYGVDYSKYTMEYSNVTTETKRDQFKTYCKTIINDKLTSLDKKEESADKWLNQVETYMYKVQSLRIRFGNLTNRMLSNIDQYKPLFELFSNNTKFPKELTDKIKNLKDSLSSVKKNISETFKPESYIEDSAVMYIEKK